MSMDPAKQRKIFGCFATGVTVASTRVGDDLWGMTANAVTSLSLDPPLVLLAVVRGTQSHAQFLEGECFALSILAEHQESISSRFAGKGPKDFADLEIRTAVTGAPILTDALAWVDCRLESVLPGGDHDTLLNSIRTKLWPLPPKVQVYSGHGPITTIGYEKQYNPYVNEGLF